MGGACGHVACDDRRLVKCTWAERDTVHREIATTANNEGTKVALFQKSQHTSFGGRYFVCLYAGVLPWSCVCALFTVISTMLQVLLSFCRLLPIVDYAFLIISTMLDLVSMWNTLLYVYYLLNPAPAFGCLVQVVPWPTSFIIALCLSCFILSVWLLCVSLLFWAYMLFSLAVFSVSCVLAFLFLANVLLFPLPPPFLSVHCVFFFSLTKTHDSIKCHRSLST